MAERPILFSAPMVRAILAGTQTQTRRVVKLPHSNPLGEWQPTRFGWPDGGRLRDGSTIPEQGGIWHTRTGDSLGCPYGMPGDRLWVRETFQRFSDDGEIMYRADPASSEAMNELKRDECLEARWRPAIHMPRWASRITLEITGVRVERLQEISEADCIAEGAPGGHGAIPAYAYAATPLEHYRHVWVSINGPGSWDANPWVWVVEFKRVPNPQHHGA